MSNKKKLGDDDEVKKPQNIKDIKNNNELKKELKEWEVESTHEGDQID